MPGPFRFDRDEARRLKFEDGLTYKEVGRRLGVSSTAVHRAINGDKRPRKSGRRFVWLAHWCPPERMDEYRALARKVGSQAARAAIENSYVHRRAA